MPKGWDLGVPWGVGGEGVKKKVFQNSTIFLHVWHMQRHSLMGPPLLGPKGQIALNPITKSISKIFKPNFVCLLTNERYKTYQTGFSFGRLGYDPGVGVGGSTFFLKFNQIWCLNYLNE